MADFTIHCCVDWSDRPMHQPCDCPHDNLMGLPIGLRIERRKRGGNEVVIDGFVCLDCGDATRGDLDLVEGLALAYAEKGRVFPFWVRLNALVAHRAADLAGQVVPVWMWGPLGLTGEQANCQWQAARLVRATAYMAERVARYARAAPA